MSLFTFLVYAMMSHTTLHKTVQFTSEWCSARIEYWLSRDKDDVTSWVSNKTILLIESEKTRIFTLGRSEVELNYREVPDKI